MSLWENGVTGKLYEIGEKIFSLGKFLVPVFGILWFFKSVFVLITDLVSEWIQGWIDLFMGQLNTGLANLGVDLTPSTQVLSFIAKANVIVPLDEAWRLLLNFLVFASVVVGIKWGRNLVPGMS